MHSFVLHKAHKSEGMSLQLYTKQKNNNKKAAGSGVLAQPYHSVYKINNFTM